LRRIAFRRREPGPTRLPARGAEGLAVKVVVRAARLLLRFADFRFSMWEIDRPNDNPSIPPESLSFSGLL
jgi:hypothetical protein